MSRKQRLVASAVIACAAAAALVAPTPAKAWWHGGWGCCSVGIGLGFFPPVYAPPPVYYAPPPVYYAPPPVYYAQPQSAAPAAAGPSCYAGQYVCPLQRPTAAGSSCSCPGQNGPVYGRSG